MRGWVGGWLVLTYRGHLFGSASHDTTLRPPLFWVSLEGTNSALAESIGPIALFPVGVSLPGGTQPTAWAVRGQFPMPSIERTRQISGYDGMSGSAALNVSVSFYAPSGLTRQLIPFKGMLGDDLITVSLPTPPVTPPPPAVPPPPLAPLAPPLQAAPWTCDAEIVMGGYSLTCGFRQLFCF